ncbi:uncharacterized protein LOC114934247 isoform X2 [Nylanderia fulva]|uniref:uncharacterized protein LOC114934247 isoform X2 n=1 Tax=Nylanderia fulva TaxID=613905 RepID=UPI0010FB1DE4|nr:uncharacterized protein LOC114934247 isoform X2 [Nylanderia fulva]
MNENEINHELWDDIFEHQQYQNIDVVTLEKLQTKVKNIQIDMLGMQQIFEEMCNKISGTPIKEKEPEEATSEEDQNNLARTSIATQQNTKDVAKVNVTDNYRLRREQLDKEQMSDSRPSEIDNEKNELMNKYLQFDEIMYQDEIIRIRNQILDYWKRYRYMQIEVQIAMQTEYFTNIISLINNLLQREDKVLKLKIHREEIRTKVRTFDVELINTSREIDHEKCKLLIDNNYLHFVEMIRQEEIKRIFVQLQTYCDKYNMPDEEVDLIKYEDFIMQRIEQIKNILNLSGRVMDFNLQIEREATNIETNNGGTSNMPSNADNLKNKLLKNNDYLWYIVKAHQRAINRLCAELESYCNDDYDRAIHYEYYFDMDRFDVEHNVEETNNVLSNTEEELKRDNENLRSFAVVFKEDFFKIYDQLQMYYSKYEAPNDNVTIVMHTEAYDPTKTDDEENELKKDNEYLAFVAMMHLEKIREIFFLMDTFCIRFFDAVENITQADSFLQQQVYVTKEISDINCQICIQRLLLNKMAESYQIKLR